MKPIFKLIPARFRGKRHLDLPNSDTPLEGVYVAGLENIDPEDPIPQLLSLRREMDRIIGSYEAAEAHGTPPRPIRSLKAGLIENPFTGFVEAVRFADVPTTVSEGLTRLYLIHSAGAKFGTFDRPTAERAWRAMRHKEEVQIHWVSRKKGRHLNYDIAYLRVLPPHGTSLT